MTCLCYSDVERTVYLTYYILMEDIAKYNELFQQERKFINFEFFNTHLTAAVDPTNQVWPLTQFFSVSFL